jgi:hypothetical protein
MVTNDESLIREIKSRISMTKEHSTRRRPFSQEVGPKFREETVQLLYLEHSFQ